MIRKYSSKMFRTAQAGKLAGVFLLVVISLGGLCHAQTYYFFENKMEGTGNLPDTFFTFLALQPDGSAFARIKSKEPVSGNEFSFEIKLKDSSAEGPDKKGTDLFLYPMEEPEMISGMSDRYFFAPRFMFRKQTDRTGTFYVPVAIEVPDAEEGWIDAGIINSQVFNEEELGKQPALLASFYDTAEAFYRYLTEERRRAIVAPRPEKMFLIVVTNTNDTIVGVSAKKDSVTITNLFTKIAGDLGVQQLERIYISADRFSKTEVDKAIAGLKPSPIDIVVFYFSGHGFRFSGDKSGYPRMSFKTKKNADVLVNNLALEEVYERIKEKKPRFGFVIGDCCNEDIGADPRLGGGQITGKGFSFTNFSEANARKLFFPEEPKSVIVASADEKQLSVGNPELGGFFTYYFAASLYRKLYGISPVSPEWYTLIIEAKEQTRRKALSAQCKNINARCIQTPIFRMLPPF